MPIVIPEHLNEVTLAGGWVIHDPQAKLMDKYGRVRDDPDGPERPIPICLSLAFDSYITWGQAQAEWQDHIDATDLCMTHLMHSNINGADINWLIAHRQSIRLALAAIPADANLEGPLEDDIWQAIGALFAAMEQDGIGLAKMTKVLCLKRPALFPMLDSYVMGMLFRDDWPAGMNNDSYADAGVVAMKQFHALLHHGNNLEELQEVRNQFNRWLRVQAAELQIEPAPVLTTVRILDNLLWFDSGGYRSFGWTWNEGDDHLQPPD